MTDATREELRPCPFCGAAVDDPEYGVQFKDNGSGPPPSSSVICEDCGAEGPMGYGTGRGDYPGSKVAAIAAWNRRITIARDGTVKLRGKATRWRAEESRDHDGWKCWLMVSPSGGPEDRVWSLADARAYLESLTDEELMG